MADESIPKFDKVSKVTKMCDRNCGQTCRCGNVPFTEFEDREFHRIAGALFPSDSHISEYLSITFWRDGCFAHSDTLRHSGSEWSNVLFAIYRKPHPHRGGCVVCGATLTKE